MSTGTSSSNWRRPYRALSTMQREICILELNRLRAGDGLRGSLKHVSLDDPGQYAALSYCWGDGGFESNINLDNDSLAITRSLAIAMQSIAGLDDSTISSAGHKGLHRRIWIDQICIDQENDDEKTSQIPLMRDVYKRAAVIIIWLGEAKESAETAFRYLNHLKTELAKGTDKQFENRRDLATLFDYTKWNACVDFLEQPWFKRRWIIQQGGLARDAIMVCGRMTMRFDDLHRGLMAVAEILYHLREVLRHKPTKACNKDPVDAISHLQSIENSGANEPMSLLKVLELTRNAKASQAPDYVFGLLGLCSSAESQQIEISYKSSARAVFKKAIMAHISVFQDLEFLGACKWTSSLTQASDPKGPATMYRPEWPSWVPDWGSRSVARQLGSAGGGAIVSNTYDGPFDASKGLHMRPIMLRTLAEENELAVSVIPIDRVESIDLRSGGEENAHEYQQPGSEVWMRYFNFCFTRPLWLTPYRTEQERMDAFVRTLALGGKSGEVVLELDNLKTKFSAWFRQTRLLENLVRMGFRSGTIDTQERRALSFNLQKYFKLVRTAKGMFGLTCLGCWVGDWICVVGGCRTPLLLRGPISSRNDYIVRGEVYLDGFMHGEAAEYAKDHSPGVQQWTLV